MVPQNTCGSVEISIHALREEGDAKQKILTDLKSDFYPRPLQGGRHFAAEGAHRRPQISIHALCEEGDRKRRFLPMQRHNFYPRPLRGGRPSCMIGLCVIILFLSTPSARRATRFPCSR